MAELKYLICPILCFCFVRTVYGKGNKLSRKIDHVLLEMIDLKIRIKKLDEDVHTIETKGELMTGSIYIERTKEQILQDFERSIGIQMTTVWKMLEKEKEFLRQTAIQLADKCEEKIAKITRDFNKHLNLRIEESENKIKADITAETLKLSAFKENIQGVVGLKGEPGLPGEPGLKGTKGEQGKPGLEGLRGFPGLEGLPGPPGLRGIQGFKGPTGQKGAVGLKGEPGLNGTKGDRGEPGLKGDKGVQGEPGVSGIPGRRGHHRGHRGFHRHDGRPGLPGFPG